MSVQRWTGRGLLLMMVVLLVCCGQSKDDETRVAPSPDTSSTAGVVEPASEQNQEQDEQVEPDTPFEAIPPKNAYKEGAGGATVTSASATIVAGDMRLELLTNAVKEPTVVQIATRKPEDFDYPMPPGFLLGAAHGTPRDAGFTPVGRWYIPLDYVLEPGTTLEVLSWHPQMRTWFNLGDAQVDASGTKVVFFTMVMGDVVLRKKPIRGTAEGKKTCEGPVYRQREEWPAKEAVAAGLSTVDDRLSREQAFRYLSDYRMQQGSAVCVFKNEERAGLWHRNKKAGESYIDEDYLMDPNAAAALKMLEYWIADEWIDPYTGEATQQIRVTEAYDSLIEHSPTSSHYHGRALDLTLSPVPPPGNGPRKAYYGRLARLAQCAGFDYVLFENNFHVHATVREAQIAVLVHDQADGYGILTGSIAAPDRWRLNRFRWQDDQLTAHRIFWLDKDTLEVHNKKGDNAMKISLSKGKGTPTEGSEYKDQRTTLFGTQRLQVVKGRLFLVNPNGIPLIGSGDDTHKAMQIPTPTHYPLDAWTVIDAAFLPHPHTEKAWQRAETHAGP